MKAILAQQGVEINAGGNDAQALEELLAQAQSVDGSLREKETRGTEQREAAGTVNGGKNKVGEENGEGKKGGKVDGKKEGEGKRVEGKEV